MPGANFGAGISDNFSGKNRPRDRIRGSLNTVHNYPWNADHTNEIRSDGSHDRTSPDGYDVPIDLPGVRVAQDVGIGGDVVVEVGAEVDLERLALAGSGCGGGRGGGAGQVVPRGRHLVPGAHRLRRRLQLGKVFVQVRRHHLH